MIVSKTTAANVIPMIKKYSPVVNDQPWLRGVFKESPARMLTSTVEL